MPNHKSSESLKELIRWKFHLELSNLLYSIKIPWILLKMRPIWVRDTKKVLLYWVTLSVRKNPLSKSMHIFWIICIQSRFKMSMSDLINILSYSWVIEQVMRGLFLNWLKLYDFDKSCVITHSDTNSHTTYFTVLNFKLTF